MKDYTTTEPQPITMYKDRNGGMHLSRDAALEANFRADLRDTFEDQCGTREVFIEDVERWLITNKQLILTALGERDPT